RTALLLCRPAPVSRLAESRFRSAHGMDHLPEFFRLQREFTIRSAVGAGERQMFLENGGSERDGGDRRLATESVIRKSHAGAEAARKAGNGAEGNLPRGGRRRRHPLVEA